MAIPFIVSTPDLSDEEIRALLVAAGVDPNTPDFSSFFQYVKTLYSEEISDLADAQYDAIVGAVHGNPPVEVLEQIAERAMTDAKDLITNLTQTELAKVHDQIASATAEGRGPRDVARKLEAVKGLDDKRAKAYENYVAELEASELPASQIERMSEQYYRKLLRDRKETIARTEMRHGTSQLQKIQAEARGALFKVWQTSGDERVSDECAANEAQGVVGIDDDFDGGVSTPPQHPNCRCTVTYVTNEALVPGLNERATARAARTQAAREGEAEE